MQKKKYRIHIRKEALKFSSAHMTVYPDGTKENLHGHNYRTELTFDLENVDFKNMIAFGDVKAAMKGVCQEWDEKVFLAAHCPMMKMAAHSPESIAFSLCGKSYVLPSDEVILLPVDNITTERLAEQFALRLVNLLPSQIVSKLVYGFRIKIEEITGQGASYRWLPNRDAEVK